MPQTIQEQLDMNFERPTAQKLATDALEEILKETKRKNSSGITKSRVNEIIIRIIKDNGLNPFQELRLHYDVTELVNSMDYSDKIRRQHEIKPELDESDDSHKATQTGPILSGADAIARWQEKYDK